jgi:hypothetical protein
MLLRESLYALRAARRAAPPPPPSNKPVLPNPKS